MPNAFPLLSGPKRGRRPKTFASRPHPPRKPGKDRDVSNERTTQTQRANLFPEVSSLFCRLPLPTLFYGLEAAHLGDLMRLWVQSGTEPLWHVWAPFNFHASIEPLQTLHETRSALLTFLSLILNQAESESNVQFFARQNETTEPPRSERGKASLSEGRTSSVAGRCVCSFLIIKQKRMIKLSLKGPPTLLKSAGFRFLVSRDGV